MSCGVLLGRFLIGLSPEEGLSWLREYEYSLYLCVFGLGIPFVILNILECKYIWSGFFKKKDINLLGVSMGIILGVSSVILF